MTKKQDLRYHGNKRIIAFVLMLLVSVAVVFAVGYGYRLANDSYLKSYAVSVPTENVKEMTVSEQEKTDYAVESAGQALDADGNVAGYVVVTVQHGYKSDIRVQTIFAADGKTIAVMRVLDQDETEYLGQLVQTEGFSALFAGRRAPMKLWGTAAKGSPIDALSGATISSQAVVTAVNNAYAFVQTRVG